MTVSPNQSWIEGEAPSKWYLAYDSLFRGAKSENKKITAASIKKELRDFKLMILQKPGKKLIINDIECFEYGNPTSDNLILHMHGGAYIGGSATTLSGYCTFIADAAKARVVSINYSLAPEHPLPICVDEVLKVYKHFVNKLNVSPSKIALTGDSAGGGLTLLAIQAMLNGGLPQPGCAVPISPWTDLSASQPSASCKVMNKRDCMIDKAGMLATSSIAIGNMGENNTPTGNNFDPKNPKVSPLFGPFKGLCPLFFVVGGAEVLLDESRICHDKALSAGVESSIEIAPNMLHTFPSFVGCFPEADASANRIASYIKTKLA